MFTPEVRDDLSRIEGMQQIMVRVFEGKASHNRIKLVIFEAGGLNEKAQESGVQLAWSQQSWMTRNRTKKP